MKDSVVITFGRFNPPTLAHQRMVERMRELATVIHCADTWRVYASHSEGSARNPLPYDYKMEILQKAFGENVVATPARTIIQVLQTLQIEGFSGVIVMVGPDRSDDFAKLLNMRNGKDYTFDNVAVTRFGAFRCHQDDTSSISGMSATHLRRYAASGDEASFLRYLPQTLSEADKKEVYSRVRTVCTEKSLRRSRKPSTKP